MNINEIVKRVVQFFVAFLQVEKLTKWFTHTLVEKLCICQFVVNIVYFQLCCFEISFQKRHEQSSATVEMVVLLLLLLRSVSRLRLCATP